MRPARSPSQLEAVGRLGLEWIDEVGEYATLVWEGAVAEDELAVYEVVRGA